MSAKIKTSEEIRLEHEKNAEKYVEAFIGLIDACGVIAYSQQILKREKSISLFHSYLVDRATEAAYEYAFEMASYTKKLELRVGRKATLIKELTESKERRKVYKYYLTRNKMKDKSASRRVYSPMDLDSKYQTILNSKGGGDEC
ncbi:hypothetical protein IKW73_00755 [Candidatus Saccharibacteria bacterium]|nr:hypothetical protein [Candidatus Saccharibacteria bacterium]